MSAKHDLEGGYRTSLDAHFYKFKIKFNNFKHHLNKPSNKHLLQIYFLLASIIFGILFTREFILVDGDSIINREKQWQTTIIPAITSYKKIHPINFHDIMNSQKLHSKFAHMKSTPLVLETNEANRILQQKDLEYLFLHLKRDKDLNKFPCLASIHSGIPLTILILPDDQIIINPVITSSSQHLATKHDESPAFFPKITIQKDRFNSITIDYIDVTFKPQQNTFHETDSICLQHLIEVFNTSISFK